ncbi:MAG TPA: hypothetical protein VHE10_00810 [Candidatus Paceibacterota bacterium]|nr:hypothetical protein [Candidatus Paceibacterota bacterium]
MHHTLAALEARRQYHEKRINLISAALLFLTERGSISQDGRIVFQLYRQQSSPEGAARRWEGNDFLETLRRALAEVESERRGPSRIFRFELFIQVDDFRVAIDPKDARALIREIAPEMPVEKRFDFTLDSRISDEVGPMVFGPGDHPPSVWYDWEEIPHPAAASHWKS